MSSWVVLGHVMWGGFFRKPIEHVLRQPIRKILTNRHVDAVVGVGAGLAALDGDAAVRICAGHVCGEVQIEEAISERGTFRCDARGAGADGKDLAGARPIYREFGLEHLCIRAGFRTLANSGGQIIQPSPITHN